MKTLALITVFVAVQATAFGQSDAGWRVVADKGAGYSVSYPGQPQDLSVPIQTSGAQLTLKGWQLEQNGLAFISCSLKMPYSTKGREDQLFAGALKGIMKKGTVLSQQSFSLHGSPGRTVLLQAPNGFVVRDTLVLRNGTLIQVATVSKADQADSPMLAKFSGSFKFLGD